MTDFSELANEEDTQSAAFRNYANAQLSDHLSYQLAMMENEGCMIYDAHAGQAAAISYRSNQLIQEGEQLRERIRQANKGITPMDANELPLAKGPFFAPLSHYGNTLEHQDAC